MTLSGETTTPIFPSDPQINDSGNPDRPGQVNSLNTSWTDSALPLPPPDSASPITCCVPGSPRVYYTTSLGEVYEMSPTGNGWAGRKLSNTPGVTPANIATALASCALSSDDPSRYYPRVYTITTNNQLWEMAWVAGDKWVAGGLPAPVPNVNPVACCVINNGRQPRVYMIVRGGHIVELAWLPDRGWAYSDVTNILGGPFPAKETNPIACCAGTDNAPRVYFIDVNGHIQELRPPPPSWKWQVTDLTTGTGAPLPATTGNPLTCCVLGGVQSCVYFTDGEGHIHELRQNGNLWSASDLTTVTNAPSPVMVTSPLASCVTGDGNTRVYYTAATGHIHELRRDNTGWHHQDITVLAQAETVARLDSPLACCVLSTGQPRLYYIGAEEQGSLHELAGHM